MGVQATADYLGVSRWTVRRLLDDGTLPFVEVRGMRRVRPVDADDYLGLAS